MDKDKRVAWFLVVAVLIQGVVGFGCFKQAKPEPVVIARPVQVMPVVTPTPFDAQKALLDIKGDEFSNEMVQTWQHEVKPGDCLWNMGNQYLGDPFLWPLILKSNRGQIENPDLIYPGQVFLVAPTLSKTEKARVRKFAEDYK